METLCTVISIFTVGITYRKLKYQCLIISRYSTVLCWTLRSILIHSLISAQRLASSQRSSLNQPALRNRCLRHPLDICSLVVANTSSRGEPHRRRLPAKWALHRRQQRLASLRASRCSANWSRLGGRWRRRLKTRRNRTNYTRTSLRSPQRLREEQLACEFN